MATNDYSDVFTYSDRIICDLANEKFEHIAKKTISKLETITEGLQSPSGSGLTNLWQEISVQIQAEYSIFWDLYDEIVEDVIEKEILSLSTIELAALQYSIDFHEYNDEYYYDIEEIVHEAKTNFVYNKAANNHEPAVDEYMDSRSEID